MNEPQELNKNLGLVLSGGGFRGVAHIGVIKLLEEMNVAPAYVSGTSAGALVGALYAAGYPSNEMLDFFLHTNLFSWKNYAFRKTGLIDPLKFLPILREYFPDDRFEALPKKMFIARTNLESGASEIIHQGPLLSNILASAALPLMFAPVEIDNILYSDGGITNNFPVTPLLPYCKHLIVVYVNPLEMKKRQEFKNIFSVMERAFHISIAHSAISKFRHCEVMIIPEGLQFHSLMERNHLQDIFDMGYQAALLHREQIQQFSDSNNTRNSDL